MSQTNGTTPAAEAVPDPVAVARPVTVAAAAIAEPRRPIYRRPAGVILLSVVVLLGIVGTGYWLYASQWEETDDAFIDGNIFPVGTKVAGQIQTVHVADNQAIRAGDVLAEIDPRDLAAKLAQAKAALDATRADAQAAKTNVELTRANTAAMLTQGDAGVASAKAAVETSRSQLASAEADVVSAQAEATRREADEKRLVALDPRGVSQSQLDAAHATADAARAQLTAANKRVAAAAAGVSESQAKVSAAEGVLAVAKTDQQQIAAAESKAEYADAQVGQAQAKADAAALDLSYTKILAPAAGRVTRKNIQPGQYVQVGQTVLAVVPQDFWVTANFKETQLTRMRVGQTVDVTVDAFPGKPFKGRVESIQAGTGARFSMLPPENATGNFVKVVQRVPVKITFDREDRDRELLGVGMSAVPSVKVNEEPKTSPAVAVSVR